MHELGIAKDLWGIIQKSAEQNELKEISKVVICVGRNSGIEKDFLIHSLKDHTFPGTIAEKAELEIRSEDVKLKCSSCNSPFENAKAGTQACPVCGSSKIDITSGKNCYVSHIEG